MRSKGFDDAFDRLAAEEERFLQTEFLAPSLTGGKVCVRIAGVVCRLRIEPADFVGWGVFRPLSHVAARLVRPAGLAERRRYLELFPLVRMILCRREGPRWLSVPAHHGDGRFRIEGMPPIELAEEAGAFDCVLTRFDGRHFWFEDLDPARDPATAAYLRQRLSELTNPAELERPGLTPEEKAAYAACYWITEKARQQQKTEDVEGRLRRALAHAGAELIEYLQRPDSYRVTYRVGRATHVSAVDKHDLTVQVSGICLDGMDAEFDLTSLVGVLREAAGR